MIPTVLLTNTSWWSCASRLAISLERDGCGVSALYPRRGHPLRKTAAVRRAFPYSAIHPLKSLVEAIEATSPRIVIPCDDRAVQHLYELHARILDLHPAGNATSALIERSLGSPSGYPIASSRCELLNLARQENIRVPDTRVITSLEDLQQWQACHPAPWILKADGTWGGHGVRIASGSVEAERAFLNLSRPLGAGRCFKRLIVDRDPYWLRPWLTSVPPVVTVQSYIAGRPANCGVVCWNGEVLAGVSAEVVAAQGVTGPATVIRIVDHPEMMRASRRLAKRLGLSGFAGFDFMISNGSGLPYLIEMNPRCTPLCALQLGAGRDLIRPLQEQLTGKPFPDLAAPVRNDTIALFPQAWHWTPQSELLRSSYHDIPWEEPALVRELLRVPWPDRGLLARLSDPFRAVSLGQRQSRSAIFDPAIVNGRFGTAALRQEEPLLPE